jgi:hypothetical protein
MDQNLDIDLNATVPSEEQAAENQEENPSPNLKLFLDVIERALARRWLDQDS